jgi:hypothetical protein
MISVLPPWRGLHTMPNTFIFDPSFGSTLQFYHQSAMDDYAYLSLPNLTQIQKQAIAELVK